MNGGSIDSLFSLFKNDFPSLTQTILINKEKRDENDTGKPTC